MLRIGMIAIVTIGALLVGPLQSASSAPAMRRLGIDVQPTKDGDYDEAIHIAKEGGAQVVSLSFNWEDIETAPNVYGNPNLSIANSYYPAQDVQVQLSIRPLDTNGPHVPIDLRDLPYDSPVVIARFDKMVDFVLSQISDVSLASLGIGNEVDAPLGADARKWAQYRRFFEAVRAHIKAKHAGLPIGVSTTFAGATGAIRSSVKALNAATDWVMITYYPLNGDFTAKDPAVVTRDFDRLTHLYAGRKIAFVEAGYPSGGACESSESKQAEFVRRVFRAWDAHATQIPFLSFSWLSDKSPDDVERFTHYYAMDSAPFREYLQTLGMRTYEGKSKRSFETWKSEAKSRGW